MLNKFQISFMPSLLSLLIIPSPNIIASTIELSPSFVTEMNSKLEEIKTENTNLKAELEAAKAAASTASELAETAKNNASTAQNTANSALSKANQKIAVKYWCYLTNHSATHRSYKTITQSYGLGETIPTEFHKSLRATAWGNSYQTHFCNSYGKYKMYTNGKWYYG